MPFCVYFCKNGRSSYLKDCISHLLVSLLFVCVHYASFDGEKGGCSRKYSRFIT